MGPPDSRGVPRAPRYSGSWRASLGFAYRPFTVCGATFQTLPLAPLLPLLQSYNPDATGIAPVWAIPRSLATTGGITYCFLFLGVLRCFSSPGSPPRKAADGSPSDCRVAPFGYPRIRDRLRLPGAFRSLPRPSSPSRATGIRRAPFLAFACRMGPDRLHGGAIRRIPWNLLLCELRIYSCSLLFHHVNDRAPGTGPGRVWRITDSNR